MASTNFVNGTVVQADWLNDVNDLTYNIGTPNGAAMVGFTQSGAGAVARTAQSKMRESVSVKDFGAVGDGVTDDTAAIQAALSSGAKQVLLNAGSYKTTGTLTIPSGVSLIGAGQRNSVIRKSHIGDGVTLSNALAYNGLKIGGFSVQATAGFENTGAGIKVSNIVRTVFEDINVSDCDYGFSMLTGYGNATKNLTLDRCNVGLFIQTSNHNNFSLTTIISNTGFTGVEMTDTCYANHFDTLDVEYALYPLWFKSGVRDITITNYYAEFNSKGARLDSNVNTVTFNGVFNSTVALFDTATFAATAVTVNGLSDEFPVGLGGVPVSGNIGNPGVHTIQNDFLFQRGVLSAAYDFSDFSKFGVNAGSHFEWTGESRINYVNSLDLSSSIQWTGSGSVTVSATPAIGGRTAYTFSAGVSRTHTVGVSSAMANRTFTVCLLVSGPVGASFELRQGDNVTFTASRRYVIGVTGPHYVFFTRTWGAGSTGSSINFVIENTSASNIDFSLPGIWESPGPMPLTERTRNSSGYTGYSTVTFKNMGATVEVLGSAAPTTGSWRVGDVVRHTAPAAGGNIGWVCTTAGTPGTWKTFGAISA